MKAIMPGYTKFSSFQSTHTSYGQIGTDLEEKGSWHPVRGCAGTLVVYEYKVIQVC